MIVEENINEIIEKRNKLQEFIKLNDRLRAESPNHTVDMIKYTTTQKLIKILNNKIMILKSLNTVAKSEPTIKTEAPKPIEHPDKANAIRNILAIQIKNETYIDNSKNKLIETQTNVVNTLKKLINIQPNQNIKSELIAKVTQTAKNYLKIKNKIEFSLNKFKELQKKVIFSIESNQDINTQKKKSESCIKQFNELKAFIIKCIIFLNSFTRYILVIQVYYKKYISPTIYTYWSFGQFSIIIQCILVLSDVSTNCQHSSKVFAAGTSIQTCLP